VTTDSGADRPPLQWALIAGFIAVFGWISLFPMYRSWAWRAAVFLPLLILLVVEKRSARFLWDGSNWPLWLMLAAFTAAMKNVVNPGEAWPRYFHLVFLLAASFAIGRGLFERPRLWEPLLLVMTALAGAVGLYALLEAATGLNPLYAFWTRSPFYGRYAAVHTPLATQFHPAALATYLLLALPFAFHLSRQAEGRARRAGAWGSVIILVAFLVSLSRSSFLGLAAMTVFYHVIRGHYRRLLAAAALLLLFVTVASFMPPPLYRMGFKGILTYKGGIFSEYRLERIGMGFAMLRDHPFCGVGVYHFKLLFPLYHPRPEALADVPYELYTSDNMYPTLIGEMGLVGLAAFLALVGTLLWRGLRRYPRTPDARHQFLVLAAMCSLVGLCLSMAGYDLFYWPGPYLMFGLVCGILAGVVSAPAGPAPQESKR
jgi:O-antigen ligase